MKLTFRDLLLQIWNIDNIELEKLCNETADNFKYNAALSTLWNTQERTTPKDIAEYYQENYLYSVHLLGKVPLDKEISENGFTTDELITKCLTAYKESHDFQKGYGYLLDYGSGFGNTGFAAYAMGYKVVMMDVDSPHARFVNVLVEYFNDKNLRFEFIRPASPVLPDAMFDVIICWQVLEHVATPLKLLKKFRKHLFPDGLLIIDTFFDDVQKFAPYHLAKHNQFGNIQYWYRCVESVGFECADSFPYGRVGERVYSWRRADGYRY